MQVISMYLEGMQQMLNPQNLISLYQKRNL